MFYILLFLPQVWILLLAKVVYITNITSVLIEHVRGFEKWNDPGSRYIQVIEAEWRMYAGLILGLRPANERRRYKVTPSLIGWAPT